jgi:hypothetical protein
MRIGLDGKMYWNSATFAAPVWNEMKFVVDASMMIEVGEINGDSRNAVWELVLAGLIKGSIEFNLKQDDTDDDWEEMLTRIMARTVTEFMFMDGDITTSGEKGIHMIGLVLKAGNDQKLQSVNELACSAKPTPNADLPVPVRYTAA